jgi:hypothetical protein
MTTAVDTTVEYCEVEFIPLDWVERAAWWPGLQVYSRPVKVPVYDHPMRRKTDQIWTPTPIDVIARLLREAFQPEQPVQQKQQKQSEPFQSIELGEQENTETL